MLTPDTSENSHYPTAPSSGLQDKSLLTRSKQLSFKSTCVQRLVTHFTHLSDLEILDLLRSFRGQRIQNSVFLQSRNRC